MMYNRCTRVALIVAVLAILAVPLAASADQTVTLSGTVKYVTSVPPRLGITVNRKTKDLIMDASFTNILGVDGTQVPRDQLKVGTGVHVFSGGTPLPIPLH
jgi:hypothetical protein